MGFFQFNCLANTFGSRFFRATNTNYRSDAYQWRLLSLEREALCGPSSGMLFKPKWPAQQPEPPCEYLMVTASLMGHLALPVKIAGQVLTALEGPFSQTPNVWLGSIWGGGCWRLLGKLNGKGRATIQGIFFEKPFQRRFTQVMQRHERFVIDGNAESTCGVAMAVL